MLKSGIGAVVAAPDFIALYKVGASGKDGAPSQAVESRTEWSQGAEHQDERVLKPEGTSAYSPSAKISAEA